jgi:hypothetical protein
MKGLRKSWNAGERVTIDESMIRYNGRAVDFVQYLPKKPIKHGLKVFAICCAVTAVLLGFEVYCGKDTGVTATAIAIVERLIVQAELTGARGRTLYTDNWYTSIDLALMLYQKYGWRFCGTVAPTNKVARQDMDVPFAKLSKGAMKTIPRGWYREAVLQMRVGRKEFYVQATSWKDRKQVMFIHTTNIGSSRGKHTVRRGKRGHGGREVFPAPLSQLDYAENYAAVDRNDRDSSDWTTSMRTNRFYFRIKFWLLDRVVHTIFVIYCWLARAEVGPKQYRKYLKKDGRFKFQVDIGIALLNYAIGAEWDA